MISTSKLAERLVIAESAEAGVITVGAALEVVTTEGTEVVEGEEEGVSTEVVFLLKRSLKVEETESELEIEGAGVILRLEGMTVVELVSVSIGMESGEGALF